MRSGAWEEKTIGELCKFTNGNGFKPSDWSRQGLPIIRIQNLNGSTNFNYFAGLPDKRWIVMPGDLLFAWAGTKGVSFGPTIWNGEKGVLNQHIYRISPISGVNKQWLYYSLLVVTSRIETRAHGFKSTLLHVHKSEIAGQVVWVPSSSEQEQIAETLGAWEQVIEKTDNLIFARTQRKRGLMQKLFSGKKRFQQFGGKKWENVRLGEIFLPRVVLNSKAEDLPLYSLTIENGLTPKTGRYDREALVRDKEAKQYKVVEPLDIVFNPSNLRWGAIGISRENRRVLVSPIYESVYVEKPDRYCRDFLFQYLSSPRQIALFAARTQGTLIERMAVKLSEFLSMKISVPSSVEEQRHIASVLNACDKEIGLLRKQLDALKQQKHGLMRKLLTGEIRLKARDENKEQLVSA